MTASNDKHLSAAPPVLAASAKPATAKAEAAPPPPLTPAQKAREEHAARWKDIDAAGGIDKWVAAQLAAKGLGDDHKDPSRMSDKEKNAFKEKLKARAAEGRALRKLAWLAYQATHVTHLGPGVFWTDSERPDRFDLDNREERAKALRLELSSVDELSKALELTAPMLRWLAYHREVAQSTHYRSWQIPKRDGSARTITAPKRRLKAAQRWALRNVFDKLPVHGAAHGFLAGRSIVTNARVHAGADVVIKVDIKDFFPTVTWRRVRGLLRKSGLPEGVATLLSLMSTEAPREVVEFRGKTLYVAQGPRCLPQGAPTSPAITNALCLRLDRRMSGLARLLGFKYTRYADDLTFSWRKPAQGQDGSPRASVGALLRGIKQILRGEGFAIHPKKTRVMRAGNRQVVTGLVINPVTNGDKAPLARVPRDTLRTLRAAINNRKKGKPGKPGESLAQLKGMAAFVFMTDPDRGKKLLDELDALEAAQSLAAPASKQGLSYGERGPEPP